MKKYILLLLAAATFTGAQAQTGISAAGTAPDAAAMLDVIATDKGFMIPRVALTALNAAGPVTGLSATSTSLLVYNTATAGTAPNDVTPGFYYWNNGTTSWVRILSGTGNPTAGNDIDFGTSSANSIDIEPTLNFVHTISAPAANNLNLNAASGFAAIVNANNGTTGATQTFRIGNGSGGADVFYVQANGTFYSANQALITSHAIIGGNLAVTGTSSQTGAATFGTSVTISPFATAGIVTNTSAGLLGTTVPGTSGYLLSSSNTGTVTWVDPATFTPKWNAITAPDGNLLLAHSANTTAFTFNGLTGANASAFSMSSSSTVGTASSASTILNLARSGVNTNTAHTAYGIQSAVTNSGGTSTNVAGYFSASGATNNYGILVPSGNVGIGTTAPTSTLKIDGSLAPKYVSTAANPYNVAQTDYYINYNTSGGVVNLPNSGTGISGRLLNIKNTTSGTVTVNAVGGELIDGAASYTLNANNSLQLINNGTATGAVTTWNVMEVSLTGGLLASGFAVPANNSVGIAAPTAGSAITAMRSDATLQINQAITPTWSGLHTFTGGITTTGTSTLSFGADASAQTISLGTGAAVKAITIGSTTTTSTTTIQAGSTVASGIVRFNAGGTTGALTVNSYGIGIGNGNVATTGAGGYAVNAGTGKLKTAGIDESSDARLKKDINPIYDALAKVTQMRGVTYHWIKPDMEQDLQFGLIAQELEKVIPELVTTDGEGWKAIEYSHLVPVLIEAIKELKTENNSLKFNVESLMLENAADHTKLETLNLKLETLMSRMAALENTVEIKTNKAEK